MLRISRNNLKRGFAILSMIVFALFFTPQLFAQSTVYFFTGTIGNATSMISVNGEELFELRGPLKKTINPAPPMKYPYSTYSPCKKKCTFKSEGKTIFSVDYKFTNASTGAIVELAAEIQLNLTEGSIHYIKLSPKGLNDMQLKEISPKEAAKLLKKKNVVELAEYIEE